MFGYDDTILQSTWGTYSIMNKITGRQYIGQTHENFLYRWKVHITSLSRGKHPNVQLQRDWDEFGADNFEFRLLDIYEGKGDRYWALYREWIHVRRLTNLYNVGMPGPNVTSGKYPRHSRPDLWATLPPEELPDVL